MTPKTILLVEDTPSIQALLAAMLRAEGHEVVTARSATEAQARFRQLVPSIVVMDLHLPDGDGEDLIQEFLEAEPMTRIIAITSDSSVSRAVTCMRAGACDFLVKPVREPQLRDAVRAASEGQDRPQTKPDDTALIGSSQVFQKVLDLLRSVSRFDAPVFLTGESGTGKSAAARAIHQMSDRAAADFVTIDCAALSPGVSGDEVFEVFCDTAGKAVQAGQPHTASIADGTLFLDNICDLDPGYQARLLKFIETSSAPPGDSAPRASQIRLISATNRDPHEEIRRGRMREDLFYRLFAVPIHMPPLRERGQDVLEVARHALATAARKGHRRPMRLSKEVEALLPALPWPGNLREVLNLVRQIVMLHDGRDVTLDMLPHHILPRDGSSADSPQQHGSLAGKTLAEIEKLAIEEALERADGSVPKAARELDVSPSTLYRKLEAWAKRETE